MMHLLDMLNQNAKLRPDKIAIINEDITYSYQELFEHVSCFANALIKEVGIKVGDKIGLMLDRKRPELIISFLAIAASGAIVTPVDHYQTSEQINRLFELIKPSAIIISDGLIEKFSSMRLNLSNNKIILITSDTLASSDFIKFNDLISGHKPQMLNSVDIKPNDIVYFNLTSGSTGMPKCAMTTHANIYWNTESAIKALKLIEEDIHLCMFPPSTHPHEIFTRSLFLGGTTVLTDHISPRMLTHIIDHNHVTCMMAIAPIYGNLARYHEKTDFDFKHLRIAESGGMHLNPILAEQFFNRFNIPILPVWGSTETTGVALAMPFSKEEYRSGSCGKQCPYYEAIIVDDIGSELGHHQIGELIIRGPGVCLGYYGDPENTQNHFKNRWYWTGDMFHKDAEGYFYFHGRKQGMMKVAGMKVFPIEIENVLIRHPFIKEVAVTIEKNDLHGEVPKVIIVPMHHSKIDKTEIVSFCKDKLAKYKVPKLIELRDELPKTPGGKILYKKLSEVNNYKIEVI